MDSMEYFRCLRERENYQSERCIDESVESKNSISIVIGYHPNSVLNLLRFHQLGSTAFPGTLLEYVWYAEKIWNGVLMVADLQQVDEMDESEFHAEKLNAREVTLHTLNIYSQSQMEQWTFVGGDQVLRTPPWQGFSQDRGEVQHDLLGESNGFPSTTKARNGRASPQSIQWSAKTSPTAKNYVEKFFGKIGHELPQQADFTTSITGENSRQINKSANTYWKVHGCTGKSVAKVNSTLFCFYSFFRKIEDMLRRGS